MERFRELNLYQRVILLLLAAMIIGFAFLYTLSPALEGMIYMDAFLQVSEENGNTVYSGTIKKVESRFVVTGENVVSFFYGERVYGPYTLREDPAAIPDNAEYAHLMTGIEILDGDKIRFRGGYLNTESMKMLYREDGSYEGFLITAVMSDGTVVDGDGNVIDQMEPDLYTILNLMEGPELYRKGNWSGWICWICGFLFAVSTAVSMLFADELFRWKFLFSVRDVDSIEPSDWVIAERYIGWTIGTVAALVFFIIGLI